MLVRFVAIVTIAYFNLTGLGYAYDKFSTLKNGDESLASAEIENSAPQSSNLFLESTQFHVDGRIRYEYGDLEGRNDSTAFTIRNRAGFESATESGFSLLAEVENTFAPFSNDEYLAYPGPGRTVIADPENTELNRLQLAYLNDPSQSSFILGRQRLILDDARFVGNVGWRQNEQTYDALRFETIAADQLTIQYAYLWQVNRIFGKDAPVANLRRFDSESHLLNLRRADLGPGSLTAFAYLLDFKDVAHLSSKTYGLRYHGTVKETDETELFYDLVLANQKDYGGNVSSYSAVFYRMEGGVSISKTFQSGIGYEVLGEDNGRSFQAPLGTNHKFNGFADAFLTTPSTGLKDYYAWIQGSLPKDFNARMALHYFSGDKPSRKLGTEVDFTLGHKLGSHATGLLKAAWFFGARSQPDITRLSIQTEYSF